MSGKFTTRKWQDQSGADKYSTEIVLQGFNATLTLLNKVDGVQHEDNSYKSNDVTEELEDSIPF